MKVEPIGFLSYLYPIYIGVIIHLQSSLDTLVLLMLQKSVETTTWHGAKTPEINGKKLPTSTG